MRGWLLLAPLALAGCTLPGPRAAAPPAAAVVPPPAWRTALPGDAAIAGDWWQGFNDPQLTALVERALAKVQGALGIIPQNAADEIVRNCELSQIDWALRLTLRVCTG